MIVRLLFAAAALAVTVPAVLLPVPAHSAPAPAAARLIQMDHISVEVVGEGPAVILVPGLSSPRAVWDGVMPEFARGHRVYRVQVNGFGGDDPRANLAPGVLDGIVADLHRLIADEKIAGAAMVGHSMGGFLGLMIARAHPGDIGRLMIVDSLPYIGALFVPNATVAMVEPQAKVMRDQIAATHGTPLPDQAVQAMASANALKPESQAKIAGWTRNVDMRVVAEAMYEVMTTDLRGDMAGIGVPVTLLYPSSAMLPKERADALYRGEYAKAPHVAFVNVADSGHFIMLDQPEAFAAALTAFLK
ncbi:alpha/beta hydrolase [Sphingomonas sp. LB-2]|uniref:alpha/beta fold hydrolase n=1 Tax=Sphingomonas caeni TaxID=2984949 RepID=UPI002230BF68|nr:alpha/beta hydrolase [Sphingomonas caeni]MCW3846042.1 alpha/beta hydrolase [Sphingomonas caeni]